MHDIAQMFESIPAPFNMVVLIMLIACVCTLLGTVASQVRIFANHRAEVQLKRDLVERGLSAEDIERVIRAKLPTEPLEK